jgi:hypothetical protein
MNILFYSRYVERGKGCRIEYTGGKGYSFFGKELMNQGCEINSCYDKIEAGTLKSYEILVIARPSNNRFSRGEIYEILKFVREGGGLFLLHDEPGDYGNKTNLNDISTNFGIRFNEGLIGGCDDFKSGWLTRPVIHRFTKHPITKGVEKIWYWGCGVTGGTPIANVCEKGITKNKAVIAATECGSGKVVCIGSPWLFCNDERYYSPYYYDEFQLGLNIINWLGEKKSPMQIKRWSFRYSPLCRRWIRAKAYIRRHPDFFEWLTFILAIAALILALFGLIPPISQFI